MSKRHKKTKLFITSEDDGFAANAYLDAAMLQAPPGKKPRGRHRRETHKRAYYDD